MEAEGSFDYDETIDSTEESLRHCGNLSGGSDRTITGLRHFLTTVLDYMQKMYGDKTMTFKVHDPPCP